LGPELGGTIGISFVFVNAMNAALNIVGFVQCLQAWLQEHGVSSLIVDDSKNDIRIIGAIVLAAVSLLCWPLTRYEAKVNIIFFYFIRMSFKFVFQNQITYEITDWPSFCLD